MTPDDFAAEYLRREREANARKEGADPRAILTALADEHGITYAEARKIVLDRTIYGAN